MHICKVCEHKELCPVARNLIKRIYRSDEINDFFEDCTKLPTTQVTVLECQVFIRREE